MLCLRFTLTSRYRRILLVVGLLRPDIAHDHLILRMTDRADTEKRPSRDFTSGASTIGKYVLKLTHYATNRSDRFESTGSELAVIRGELRAQNRRSLVLCRLLVTDKPACEKRRPRLVTRLVICYQ